PAEMTNGLHDMVCHNLADTLLVCVRPYRQSLHPSGVSLAEYQRVAMDVQTIFPGHIDEGVGFLEVKNIWLRFNVLPFQHILGRNHPEVPAEYDSAIVCVRDCRTDRDRRPKLET